MFERGELADGAWAQIAPLMPENGRRGGRWRNHREVVNGILWKLRTGAPWRDLPERYGPWQTCYDRFSRRRRDGTWDRLLSHAQARSDEVGEVEWLVSVDSTVARAHQHAAGARRKPSREDSKRGGFHPPDEARGRSRGDLSTKLHLSCDGKGRPLSVVVTPGQGHESTQLAPVLDAIRVAHPEGRPRRGPSTSSPTRATATQAAGCSCADVASRAQSPSGATSARDAGGGWDDRRPSTG